MDEEGWKGEKKTVILHYLVLGIALRNIQNFGAWLFICVAAAHSTCCVGKIVLQQWSPCCIIIR